MSYQNATQLTVQFIKRNGSSTLTSSQTATTNLTGTIIASTGYVHQGANLDEDVVGATVTVCMTPELGQAVLEEVTAIYAEREAAGNLAPVIAISFNTSDKRIAGNILAYGISNVEIDDTYVGDVAVSVSSLKDQLAANKAKAQAGNEAALNRASLIKKRNQIAAEAVVAPSLMQIAKPIIARKG